MDVAAIPLGAGWKEVFVSLEGFLQPVFAQLAKAKENEECILPEESRRFAAFTCPFNEVKVIILGQDPYPTPGNANGLAFSVSSDCEKIPASLRNIFKEYQSDLGLPLPTSGDLSPWVGQGVLLLNTVLTVQAGQANSHHAFGWQAFTHGIINALVRRDRPLVSVLWGAEAKKVTPLLGRSAAVCSPHPSPLSAYRGFFGSKPFTKTNELLLHQGGEPVDWTLT